MKNKIILISVFVLIVLWVSLSNLVIAVENRIYELKLDYDNGVIGLKDIVVKPGLAQEKQIKTGYKAELISFKNDILDSFRFNIPLTIFIDEFNPETGEITSGITHLNKTYFTLRIPYFKNGKTINIYDPNNTKVLAIDVGYFADVCPNNICDPHESYEKCPQDCPSGQKDDYCDKVSDGICDPDCISGDFDCEARKTDILALLVIVTILLVIVIFGYLEFNRLKYQKTLKKKSEMQELLELKTYIAINLKKGYSTDRLRQGLLKAGWSKEMVDNAFQDLKR